MRPTRHTEAAMACIALAMAATAGVAMARPALHGAATVPAQPKASAPARAEAGTGLRSRHAIAMPYLSFQPRS